MKAQHSRGAPLGIRATVGFLALLLAASLTGAGLSIHQALRSRDYVEVRGEIVDREYGRARDKLGETQQQRERRQSTVYFNLRYRYTVDGKEYLGDRIQAGTFGLISGANKRDFEQRFPLGAQVPVYVDPEDPRTAVLVRGWSHIATLFSALSVFLFVGLCVVSVVKRAMAQPQSASRLPR
jgi:hypothetical protein